MAIQGECECSIRVPEGQRGMEIEHHCFLSVRVCMCVGPGSVHSALFWAQLLLGLISITHKPTLDQSVSCKHKSHSVVSFWGMAQCSMGNKSDQAGNRRLKGDGGEVCLVARIRGRRQQRIWFIMASLTVSLSPLVSSFLSSLSLFHWLSPSSTLISTLSISMGLLTGPVWLIWVLTAGISKGYYLYGCSWYSFLRAS